MNAFNKELRSGTAIKRFFPGVTASQLKHYIQPHLFEDNPDIVIIHVGSNNLSKKTQTAMETAQEIIEIVKKCQLNGVNEICVSGITIRPEYQVTIDMINHILESDAGNHNYKFINNENIGSEHLWKDNLHLLDGGIRVLKYNFLNFINRHSTFYNNY